MEGIVQFLPMIVLFVVGYLFWRLIKYIVENFKSKEHKANYLDELRELGNLQKEGVITVEEFEKQKKKILDSQKIQ
ncbi:SHOCT domain-containing protein [uncultured Eudoraea sp.]|uniref:SHOCT domain-containing protein n=1 Tax=uncultured Eudoraea sp. TaxID=1035614 RepID=UPI0026394B58|nr:SHOCT domain-containing protein [uncultured Eudoraea sp.]